jgi:translocation and assembly module TamB
VKKWLKRLGKAALALFAAWLALAIYMWSGAADRHARSAVAAQIEKATGGRVELKSFRFSLLDLKVEMEDFTLRGSEPEGSPPFFHADRIVADARVDSLLRRKFSLDSLDLLRFGVHVRVNRDGTTNIPKPQTPRPAGEPMREQIFSFLIRRLKLEEGSLLINNTRVPLVAEGGRFDFTMRYAAGAPGEDFYAASLAWKQMHFAARRYLPFTSDLAAEFTLGRNSFEVARWECKLPQSEFRGAVKLENFSQPAWTFRYAGTLSLLDLKQILRKPNSPGGSVEFKGAGSYARGALKMDGSYAAHKIDMPYQWFHEAGIESRGTFRVADRRLVVPDLTAEVLGGKLAGKLEFQFDGAKFRVESRAEGMSVARILRAVDNPGIPLVPLHWNGAAGVDAVSTWTADFKHFASRGVMRWTPQGEISAEELPVSALFHYDWDQDRKRVALQRSHIVTPASRVEMDGVLARSDSGLSVRLESKDLLEWNDFINRLRGPDADPRRIAGAVEWQGTVAGEIARPAFAGRVHARRAAYGSLYWDEARGEVTYSPEALRLENFFARRGDSTAALEYEMQLEDWSFRPESAWSLDVSLVRARAAGLLELFTWEYPVDGLVTARLHGGGTRSRPEISGPVTAEQIVAYGIRAERARGLFRLNAEELRIAEGQAQSGAARVAGHFFYRFEDRVLDFSLDGAEISLEQIEPIQTERFPIRGRLSFRLRGSGPVTAPVSEGTMRLAALQVGPQALGSLAARVSSTGRAARFELSTEGAEKFLEGTLEMTLAADYPLRGAFQLRSFDLSRAMEAALRPRTRIKTQAVADGKFTVSGAAARPESLAVEADISALRLGIEDFALENAGPLRFRVSREELRVEQAQIRGPQTALGLGGYVRFTGPRSVDLQMRGSVDLLLLTQLVTDLDARGVAQVNAAVQGTLDRPLITGGAHLQDASARYGEFPAVLSRVSGDFVFDRNRMVFENVSAEAGGGSLVSSGTVTYGEGPLRFDISMRAARVRIRYPQGMSWLFGGSLRLRGTPAGGELSGRVVVDRLFLSEDFNLATLIVTSRSGVAVPGTTSEFVRNLQFDIEAQSAPNARIQWSAAWFENEATLRLRGTWQRPIFLGHIHLLSGEMTFRGNRYRLTRGDLNFADPRRVDPVLDLEAVTNIQRYEITVNFSGPSSALSLSYRSDPPLPQTDIIALLALGRTGEESALRTADSAGQVSEGAAAILSEAISSQLGGRIERLFGISRFKIDPFQTSTAPGSSASSARITLEQQVARDLTITYSTNVDSTQEQIIQVEYNFSQDISIIALRDRNGTFGLDVRFKKRFR